MKGLINGTLSAKNADKKGNALISGKFVIFALECTPYEATFGGATRQCLRWELVGYPPEDLTQKGEPKATATAVRVNVTPYRNTLYTSDTGGKGGKPVVFIPAGNFGATLHTLFAGRTPQQVADATEDTLKGHPTINVGITTFYDYVGEYPRQVQTLEEA